MKEVNQPSVYLKSERTVITLKNIFKLLSFALILTVFGCNTDNNTDIGPVKRSWGAMKGLEYVVGNMNVSYSSEQPQKPRLNALNKPVAMTNFEGKYVWVEYAAPGCEASALQTPETKIVEAELHGQVMFLRIMTSKSHKYEDYATVSTAKQWSNRFRLDPEHVLAAENLWSKKIPEHRFYSPQGHTLFVHVGYLHAEEIRSIISYYRTGWQAWAETGEVQEWMTEGI